MRKLAATLALIGLVAAPLAAQGRSGRRGKSAQGIPPGHLPPSGACRVWYDGRPPGHQPAPTSCREAEAIAARDWNARVIYGDDRARHGREDGRWDRDEDRRGRDDDRDRAIPRRSPSRYPSPDRYPYPEGSRYPYPDRYPDRYPDGRGGYGYQNVAFDNGYKDGYDKGREDARDNDRYDPVRHQRYRSADHGYNGSYGSKEEYKTVYREGFVAGYEEGYRDTTDYDRDRRPGSVRLPWPF